MSFSFLFVPTVLNTEQVLNKCLLIWNLWGEPQAKETKISTTQSPQFNAITGKSQFNYLALLVFETFNLNKKICKKGNEGTRDKHDK